MKIHLGRHDLIQLLLGAFFGVVALHPLTTLIFYFEFAQYLEPPPSSAWSFLANRLRLDPWMELVPMSAVYALVGAVGAHVVGSYTRRLQAEQRRIDSLHGELDRHLPSLVDEGEGERLEFKSSLRWDRRAGRSNKALEQVIAKSIAGLMNHRGGTLLIGITDAGEAVGIEDDYQTLKHKNSDGFERAVMDLVRHALGPQACTLLHCHFPFLAGVEVCRIVIEPSDVPVFFRDGDVARYFVRTGNSTREFDAQQAHEHLSRRRRRRAT